jgi:SPP1 family predicted phage head-tail adaptor
MGLNFGSYDQSITFGNFGSTDDGYGGAVVSWTPELTTFARIMQIRGGNQVESLQLTLPRTYRMGVQWRSTFQPDESMQILYRGAYHKINAIELMEERMTKEYVITMIRVGNADNPNFNETT